MGNKIKVYNSLFALFLKEVPPHDLMLRYFNNSRDEKDEMYDDDGFAVMQDFVCNNMKDELWWSTSIGIIEAVEHIIEEAVTNGNIDSEFKSKHHN